MGIDTESLFLGKEEKEEKQRSSLPISKDTAVLYLSKEGSSF